MNKFYKIFLVSFLLVILVLSSGCNKSGCYFSGECEEFSVGRGEVTIHEESGLIEFGQLNIKSGDFDDIKRWSFGFYHEGEEPFYSHERCTENSEPEKLPYNLGSTDSLQHAYMIIQRDDLFFRLEVEDFDGNKEVYNIPMKLHK